jgi:4-amino-4-deoxy-L-arabinose transferase-like glycosyltransferase
MYNLGSALPIIESEKFYFQSVKEMFARHDWITPYYHGQFRFAKPILFYWFVSLSYLVFGINNFGARFPSALFGILTVIFTFNIGRKLFDRKTGLLAAGILTTFLIFFMYARYASPDMALTFFITYSIYLFVKALKGGGDQRGIFALFFVMLGLATAIKGFVGFMLPLIIVLTFIASTKKWQILKPMNILAGIFIILAIGLPWYLVMYKLHGDQYLHHIIAKETLERVAYNPHQKTGYALVASYLIGLFGYIPILFIWFIPYSLFLPAAMTDVFKNRNGYQRDKDSYKLILSFFFGIFIFFSLVSSKIYHYMLPTAPAFALIVARYLINLKERNAQFKSMNFKFMYVSIVAIYTFGIAAIIYAMHHLYPSRVAFYDYAIILAPLIAIVPYIRRKNISTLFALPIAIIVFMVFLVGSALPLLNDNVLLTFSNEIKTDLKEGDNVGVGSVDISQQRMGVYLDMPIEEVNFRGKGDDVFERNKDMVIKFLTSGNDVYIIMTEEDYQNFIPDDLKAKLVIIDKGDTWRSRLKRKFSKETVIEVLRGEKDLIKDVLRHRVYLVTNKKITSR